MTKFVVLMLLVLSTISCGNSTFYEVQTFEITRVSGGVVSVQYVMGRSVSEIGYGCIKIDWDEMRMATVCGDYTITHKSIYSHSLY